MMPSGRRAADRVRVWHNGPVTWNRAGRNSSKEHKWHLLYLEMGNNAPTWNSTTWFPPPLFQPAWWTSETCRGTKRPAARAVRDSLPRDPACFKPAFVFFRSSSGSPGRVWRTALCMPVYYVIPITQQNPQCSAAHLPFIQRDENIYSPIADRHAFLTPCTSGGEMNII